MTRLAAILLTLATAYAAPCRIRWDAPPPAEQVTEWRVWRGIELLATVTTNSATLDLPADQTSTITVQAVNAGGESAHSDPLTCVPHRLESSTDLRTWTPLATVYFHTAPQRFLRLSLPSPR